MTPYDSTVIQQMADALYAQAKGIELKMAVSAAFRWGILLSLLGGSATFATMSNGDWVVVTAAVAVMCGGLGMLTGAMSGYRKGRERSFSLRLEAQRALCFVQIERNTAQMLDGG